MTIFSFEELQPVFLMEAKDVFMQFVKENTDKVPYIFSIVPRDYSPADCSTSFSITACANTKFHYENQSKDESDEAEKKYYYYSAEEFEMKYNFPKTDEIILHYCIENKNSISDDKTYEYTKEFLKFKANLYDFLIKNIIYLKNTGFFNSVYKEKMIIDVFFPDFDGESDEKGMKEYYAVKKIIQRFKKFNPEEDEKQYKKYLDVFCGD